MYIVVNGKPRDSAINSFHEQGVECRRTHTVMSFKTSLKTHNLKPLIKITLEAFRHLSTEFTYVHKILSSLVCIYLLAEVI